MVYPVTAKDFEQKVIYNSLPVLVNFYAEKCSPCKMLLPVIDALSNEFDNKLFVCRVNIDTDMQIPEFYGIINVPSIILFKNGVEIFRLIGVQQKETLTSLIKENIYE